MIATGGLLRINARSRQESQTSKTRRPPAHRRRDKRRSSEVVVVKARLQLVSLAGLTAALGLLVLLVGLLMAALGYWPEDGLLFHLQPPGRRTTSARTTPGPSDLEVGGVDGAAEQTGSVNGTAGFLGSFLDRYLHSDWLKVLGPLVMGVGIFLFLCANTVLHEERDRHSRVINLRDVYSTVIDLHRRTGSAPSATPTTHLINYCQATSLQSRARSPPHFLQRGKGGGGARRGEGAAGSTGAGGAGGGAARRVSVFSVHQELSHAPPPPPPLGLSHLPTGAPPREAQFRTSSLPLPRPQPPAAPCRRHSLLLLCSSSATPPSVGRRRSLLQTPGVCDIIVSCDLTRGEVRLQSGAGSQVT